MSERRGQIVRYAIGVVLLLLAGCAQVGGGEDGDTPFKGLYGFCDAGDRCADGLTCLGGLCSVECTTEGDCDSLDGSCAITSTELLVGEIIAAPLTVGVDPVTVPRICVPRCTSDSDCASGFDCDEGLCALARRSNEEPDATDVEDGSNADGTGDAGADTAQDPDAGDAATDVGGETLDAADTFEDVLDNEDATDAACEPNVCGGCAVLSESPGESCGECSAWRCDGEDALACVDSSPVDCSCTPIVENAVVGTECGDNGTVVCENNLTTCLNDPNDVLPDWLGALCLEGSRCVLHDLEAVRGFNRFVDGDLLDGRIAVAQPSRPSETQANGAVLVFDFDGRSFGDVTVLENPSVELSGWAQGVVWLDESTLLTAAPTHGENGVLYVAEGESIRSIDLVRSPDDAPMTGSLAASGHNVAFGTPTGLVLIHSDDGEFASWSTRLILEYPDMGEVSRVEFDISGDWLAVSRLDDSGRGAVDLYDLAVESPELVHTVREPEGLQDIETRATLALAGDVLAIVWRAEILGQHELFRVTREEISPIVVAVPNLPGLDPSGWNTGLSDEGTLWLKCQGAIDASPRSPACAEYRRNGLNRFDFVRLLAAPYNGDRMVGETVLLPSDSGWVALDMVEPGGETGTRFVAAYQAASN